jgi:hypothetical protein
MALPLVLAILTPVGFSKPLHGQPARLNGHISLRVGKSRHHWVGDYYQVGVEAIVLVNRASGEGVGAIAQLHLYLDDILPTTIGKPLFGSPSPTAGRPSIGN